MNLNRELFELLKSLGEGVREEGFHIYMTDADDVEEWRCDMGELGSFMVYRNKAYEEFSLSLNDWVTLEEPFYSYCDMSEVCEDYPELPIEKAFDHLSKYLEN